MNTPTRYGTHSTTRGAGHQTSQLTICRFSRDPQRPSPGAIVAGPREPRTEPTPATARTSTQIPLQTPVPFAGTPAVFRMVMEDSTQHRSRLDTDLRAMLQALPTRADIETLIQRIEEAHSRDIQEIRTDLHTVTDRVASRETVTAALESRVQALECANDSHTRETQEMQLHLEKMEDRSRRNNLRLRGIPEATGPEDLQETVTAIFHRIMEAPPPSLEIDRLHRTLGPKSTDPSRPRDVLCRLHRYAQKEVILRKETWEISTSTGQAYRSSQIFLEQRCRDVL